MGGPMAAIRHLIGVNTVGNIPHQQRIRGWRPRATAAVECQQRHVKWARVLTSDVVIRNSIARAMGSNPRPAYTKSIMRLSGYNRRTQTRLGYPKSTP